MTAITKQLTTGLLVPVSLDAALHVDALENYDIAILLDTHLFMHSAWCDGAVVLREERGHVGSVCRVCGACDVHGKHVRLVPWYSIEQIASAIAARDEGCLTRFALALYRHMHRGEAPRTLFAMIVRFIDVLRMPRIVAVAALEALKVVDERGYVRGGAR